MLLDKRIAKTPPKWIGGCRQVEKQSSHRNVIIHPVLVFQLPSLTIRIGFHAENLYTLPCFSEPTGNAVSLPLGSTKKVGRKMMRSEQDLQSEFSFFQDNSPTPIEPIAQKTDFFRVYNA